jgi:hypothetical protein
MPSRQKQRKAAAAAAAAAAALADLNVNAGGDWKTQAESPGVGSDSYFALLITSKLSSNSRDEGSNAVNDVASDMSVRPDPWALFEAVDIEVVKQRAVEGDREAQFSHGYLLVMAAGGPAGDDIEEVGTVDRQPKLEVGLALGTARFPVDHQAEVRRCGHQMTEQCNIRWCQP